MCSLKRYLWIPVTDLWIPVTMVDESCIMIEMIPVPNVGESGIISDSIEFMPGLFVLKYLSRL